MQIMTVLQKQTNRHTLNTDRDTDIHCSHNQLNKINIVIDNTRPCSVVAKQAMCAVVRVGQYYHHYAILGYAISISQRLSHFNNIAYAIYCRISPNIAGNILHD